MTPRVSIIVPCYNAEPWVAAALDSALAQTWPDTEVIAVDDGSRDGSLAILRRYAGPRVRVLNQPNRGASAARNAGIRAATGSLLQFLDADDLLAPGKIAAQVALLAGRPAGTTATGRWSRFTAAPGDGPGGDALLYHDFAPADYVAANIRNGIMMHPAAWLVPADVARRAGPWNEQLSLNDDGEYFARVALASSGIAHAPGAEAFYRSGLPGSLSRRSDRRAMESLSLSYQLVAEHLLGFDGGPSMRAAAADYFQRLVYETYLDAPDLARAAAARAAALGGSAVRAPMGARLAAVNRLFGWKVALRLGRLRRRR